MNYDLFLQLVNIPDGLDRSIKKIPVTKEQRQAIASRDNSTCQVCGLVGAYGNPGFSIPGKLAIHHIIPNSVDCGDYLFKIWRTIPGVVVILSILNYITLCRYCHNAVHALLYASGKWRYVPMK